MKKLLSIILCILAVISLIPMCVAAECSASVNDVSVSNGDSVTVVFEFTADAGIKTIDTDYTYNPSALQFVSGSTSFGGSCSAVGSTLNFNDSGDGSATAYSVTLNFNAIKSGTSQVNLTGGSVEASDGASLGNPTASCNVSVSQQSADCTLKALGIPSGCTLSPAFVPTVTSYTCTVPYDVTSFPIDEVTTDPAATTKIEGNIQLVVGKNVRTVTVTAPNGTQKIYTITITREEAPEPTAPPKITITSGQNTYTLSYTVSAEAPAGFTKTVFTYKGSEFECYASGTVRLVEIYNSDKSGLCIYDTETDTFSQFTTLSSVGKTYTVFRVAPVSPGSEYNTDPIVIDDTEYLAWSGSTLDVGYHILYVLNNETGEKYFALYCEYDGSIQKLMNNFGSKQITVTTVETDNELPVKLIIAIITGVVGLLVLGAVVVKKIMDWRMYKAETQDDAIISDDDRFTKADIEVFEQMRAEEEAKKAIKAKKN